jgi:uncharacterized protein YdhG (YjbR/CyaY superfamily)
MRNGTQPDTVDAYLAALPADQRAALETLMAQIEKAAPEAERVMAYGLPSYRLHGALVSVGAAKAHCAFYGMSATMFEEFGEELAAFSTSKGTVRFTPDKPIPARLTARMVKARIAENIAARAAAKERAALRAKARRAKG